MRLGSDDLIARKLIWPVSRAVMQAVVKFGAVIHVSRSCQGSRIIIHFQDPMAGEKEIV